MANEPDHATLQAEQMQAFLRAPIPRFYANGFGVAQSASDLSIVFLLNNAPAGMLSMSYISAKSLLVDLGKAMESIETALKQPVPTISEVAEELQKLQGKLDVS